MTAPNERAVLGALRILGAFLTSPAAPASPVTDYSSSSRRGTPSPGKTSRWLRENARHIPGARKVGRDWVVSVRDFDRWASSDAQREVREGTKALDDDALADSFVAAAGLRTTRKAGAR